VLNWLAAGRIGALVTCLSSLFQAREIDWALRHNDIDTLIVCARHLSHDYIERLERAVPGLAEQSGRELCLASHPYLRRIVVIGACDRPWALPGREALAAAANARPAFDDSLLAAVEAQVTPSDDLITICTSGTTAEPKAVVHTHGSMLRTCRAYIPITRIEPGDRVYNAMPLFWVGGLLCSLAPALIQGAAITFSDTNSADDVLDVVLRHRITVVILGWSVAGFDQAVAARGADISFVRFGLEPPREDDGSVVAPERRAAGQLGMTETFGVHSWTDLTRPAAAGKVGHWGQPLGTIERRVVDPESRAVLPPGEQGELELRGPPLMRGYYKVESHDAFGPDGFFRTGDICSLDADGYLYFHGRNSEMIKTAGANVAPREVEIVLAAFDGVREAIVFGVPDASRGEAVAAVVVSDPGADVEPAALLAWVRSQLSSYKAPRHIVLKREHEIPRTVTGKVKKHELRELLLAQSAA
jgi:acyl-CoA synthetase (AMP-forming)/AMP-acid ligase II